MPSNTTDNVALIKHSVIARDLTILRNKNSSIAQFREAAHRISIILASHALKNISVRSFKVNTPIQETTGYDIEQKIMIVPILRAGLSMVDAILQFMPNTGVGHLGMYRDEETLQPVDYYSNIPKDISKVLVLVVDPMLATGGSADGALAHLKKEGAQHLRFISLISAPEGIKFLRQKHPDVQIITAAIDEKLNDDAFIVPGLGDAGDRYFGTE